MRPRKKKKGKTEEENLEGWKISLETLTCITGTDVRALTKDTKAVFVPSTLDHAAEARVDRIIVFIFQIHILLEVDFAFRLFFS